MYSLFATLHLYKTGGLPVVRTPSLQQTFGACFPMPSCIPSFQPVLLDATRSPNCGVVCLNQRGGCQNTRQSQLAALPVFYSCSFMSAGRPLSLRTGKAYALFRAVQSCQKLSARPPARCFAPAVRTASAQSSGLVGFLCLWCCLSFAQFLRDADAARLRCRPITDLYVFQNNKHEYKTR